MTWRGDETEDATEQNKMVCIVHLFVVFCTQKHCGLPRAALSYDLIVSLLALLRPRFELNHRKGIETYLNVD